MFATDNGNANKDLMKESFLNHPESRKDDLLDIIELNIMSDIIDSFFVCQMLTSEVRLHINKEKELNNLSKIAGKVFFREKKKGKKILPSFINSPLLEKQDYKSYQENLISN